MLILALLLITGGLVTAVILIVFMCENLLAIFFAVLAARAALLTGGGWPAAMIAAFLTFALVSVALRFAVGLARPLALRLVLAAIALVPAATAGYLVSSALLWPLVPAAIWRTILSALAATIIAAGAWQRLVAFRPAA